MAEKEEISTAKDSKVFDFFGLPRDLRNDIYDLLTHQKTLDSGYDHGDSEAQRVAAWLDNIPLAKLFTLSRQFKDEYEETFKHGFTIVCKDLGSISGPRRLTNIPITTAEFLLLAICDNYECDESWCDSVGDLDAHASWIEELLHQVEGLKQLNQVQGLKELRFKIYKCQIGSSDESNASIHLPPIEKCLSRLTEMRLASRVEMYPVFVIEDGDRNPWNGVEAYEAELQPEKVWTKRDGWEL